MKGVQFLRGVFLLLSLLLLPFLAAPRSVHAMSSDVKTLITTSLYGMAAGTALGLVSLPFTRDGRAVFLGSSIGLYTGAVVGIYHIYHRDDPYNPLRAGLENRARPVDREPPALVEVQFPLKRF